MYVERVPPLQHHGHRHQHGRRDGEAAEGEAGRAHIGAKRDAAPLAEGMRRRATVEVTTEGGEARRD